MAAGGPFPFRLSRIAAAGSYWASLETTQFAWHAGHLELFRRYGGVALWVRIDNPKTGMAWGAGSNGVIDQAYRTFARECSFDIDPCRVPCPLTKAR